MRMKLSEQDIKDLKYQCRMGYIIPFFFFTIGSFAISGLVHFIMTEIKEPQGDFHIYITIAVVFSLSILINYLMNGKYKKDIQNGEKILEQKTIERKVSMIDAEAGSATVGDIPHNRKMNTFIRYDLIIDNTKYRIDKNLFDMCNEGDKVYFHIAPISRFRIKIDLK
ncbi:hypothetical protein [Carboxylicivirga marina]|uniref:hypothetical protein n=1 Tax=Carboxylicivirga marina TaxID=2800988 RepID=UPI002597061B|nr:hypothetical protein [uncultured Carboxylicivirga sp.]